MDLDNITNTYKRKIRKILLLPSAYYSQNRAIKNYSQNTKNLIIILIPVTEEVGGGLKMLYSLADKIREYNSLHNSEVILSTLPSILTHFKNKMFENSERIYRFNQLLSYFNSLDHLEIWIPDFASGSFIKCLSSSNKKKLKEISNLKFVIANQNLDLMPEPESLNTYYEYTPNVMQICTPDSVWLQDLCNTYNMPVHYFSLKINPKEYHYLEYNKKEDIIVLSPDICITGNGTDEEILSGKKMKNSIIQSITDNFQKMNQITVSNMKYEEYKDLISRSKYLVTFGGGNDYFFMETYLSGSIAFAVMTPRFCPSKEFSDLPTVYSSFEEMRENIAKDIMYFEENPRYYEEVNTMTREIILKYFGPERFAENVKQYFLKNYTCFPNSTQ